jgi:hypothetical protein
VLYLALEDSPRRLQRRCRVLLGEKLIPELFSFLTRLDPGMYIPTIVEWLTEHSDTRPLVIIDTLGKVMGAARSGEGAYQRDYRLMGELHETITQFPGASLACLHHTRKAESSDYGDKISGTYGLLGAADTGLVLTRARTENAGTLSVTGRDLDEAEYALTMSDGAWLLDGNDLDQAQQRLKQRKDTANLGDRSSDIYTFVRDNPGSSPSEVGKKFGMQRNEAAVYLSRLVETGRLVKQARGKYAVSTVSTVSTPISSVDTNVVQIRPVDTVDTVDIPGQRPTTMSTDPPTTTE